MNIVKNNIIKMKENDKLIIEWEFDEKDMNMGMYTNSFVSSPATETNWNLFSKSEKFQKNEMKRIVTGPVMLADTLIYRVSPSLGEYWGKFSKETIEKMMIKYFKDGYINKVNEEHTPTKQVRDVYLIESYIINDRTRSELYKDLPEGSWIASYYIEDEKYWNEKIMNGNFNGFSLEGMFIESMEENMSNKFIDDVKKVVSETDDEIELRSKLRKLMSK